MKCNWSRLFSLSRTDCICRARCSLSREWVSAFQAALLLTMSQEEFKMGFPNMLQRILQYLLHNRIPECKAGWAWPHLCEKARTRHRTGSGLGHPRFKRRDWTLLFPPRLRALHSQLLSSLQLETSSHNLKTTCRY